MKVKRFIKEYANYKISEIKDNELMQDKYKLEKVTNIKKYIKVLERGLITIDECIYQINKI